MTDPLVTAHEDAVHARARADAARLRAAAAIVAVRGNDTIADWLDELAARMTAEHVHEWIDDTDYADHGRRYVCATCGAVRTEPYDQEDHHA